MNLDSIMMKKKKKMINSSSSCEMKTMGMKVTSQHNAMPYHILHCTMILPYLTRLHISDFKSSSTPMEEVKYQSNDMVRL